MSNANIGDRMKQYEDVNRKYLMRKAPVILRLDGVAFHTLCANLIKPFDELFQNTMLNTALRLCTEIQGAQLAYVQSDEISILLTDWNTIQTDCWFGYNLQKLTSVSASKCSVYFNNLSGAVQLTARDAFFDSRAFNLPMHEVINYFIWRQQDATRNSIQSAAQACFSQKSLNGLNSNQLQEKLFTEAGRNWNDYPTVQKRGACVIKGDKGTGVYAWKVDYEIPVFTQDRNYINSRLNIGSVSVI